MTEPTAKPVSTAGAAVHDAKAMWHLWKQSLAAFPLWRRVLSILAARSQWFSLDSLDAVLRSRSYGILQALLRDASPDVIDRLKSMGRLNAERQSAYLRIILIAYFTVPLGIAAIWVQVVPDGLSTSLRQYPSFWAGGGAGLTTAVLGRFLMDWQARNLHAALELISLEHAAKPPEGILPPAA